MSMKKELRKLGTSMIFAIHEGRSSDMEDNHKGETIMKVKIDLRKLAEDNIKFRFENDKDRDEFWELYVNKNGNMDADRSRKMLSKYDCWELWIYSQYDKVTFNVCPDDKYPTWTEIKEKYSIKPPTLTVNVDFTEAIKSMNKVKEVLKDFDTTQAITLLKSQGYTVTPPYIEPTDEEICNRLKIENEKVGYVGIWDGKHTNYKITFTLDKSYMIDWNTDNKNIGTIYTTQSIAKQIVEELNEKRFVRV